MPMSAKRPCNYPGCGTLVKSGRCDKHNDKQKTNYRHTKTQTERGYGYAWQKLRLLVFKRDNKLCQVCLKAGRLTEAQAVDHIMPKAKGGDDSLDNLQSICNKCHNNKTSSVDSKGWGGL